MHLLKKFLRNTFGGAIGALIGGAVGVFLLMFSAPPERARSDLQSTLLHDLVGRLVHWSYDIPLVLRDDVPVDEAAIVYIDEDSNAVLKQNLLKGWNRAETHARLLDRLKADGARMAVFDIIFTGPSDEPADDERFAEAIKSFGDVIIGADESPAEYGRREVESRQIDLPFELFTEADAMPGLVMLQPDSDLVVRKHPPMRLDDFVLPMSWTAAALLNAPSTQMTNKTAPERWINYYGPPAQIPNVTYWRALDTNEVKQGFFRDKVVFIGLRTYTRSAAERKDEYASPYDTFRRHRARSGGAIFMPGVEVHATMFVNLMRDDGLRRMSRLQEASFVVMLGMLFGIGLAQVKPLIATVVAGLGAALVAYIGYIMFTETQTWFAWMIVVVQIGATMVWSVIFNSWQAVLQNRLLTQSISMYLSPSQAKRIAKRGDAAMLQPGAVKQEISLLFSDIANFTTMSEGMDPDDLARLMNNYFESAVSHCIYKTEGTVVKFIGDAIFAIWNAPDPQLNHRQRACEAAILMRDQVTDFDIKKPGLEVRTRIGLHCGEASVGNFGSRTRVDYTAFGENVNLSARMEGLNKYLGTSILATGDIVRPVEDMFVTRFVGLFQLKGFNRAVEVFELIDLLSKAEESRGYRELFARALQCLKAQQWNDAEAGFQAVLAIKPNDGPSAYYLKQIPDFRGHSFGENWNGAIELKEK